MDTGGGGGRARGRPRTDDPKVKLEGYRMRASILRRVLRWAQARSLRPGEALEALVTRQLDLDESGQSLAERAEQELAQLRAEAEARRQREAQLLGLPAASSDPTGSRSR